MTQNEKILEIRYYIKQIYFLVKDHIGTGNGNFFLYVDIEGKKVGCIDPVTKIVEEKNIGKRIGTVVPSIIYHNSENRVE